MKYKSEELRKEFERVWNMILAEQLSSHFEWNTHISQMILDTHGSYESGKNEILENKIVKLADILQAIGYTISEKNLWNVYLQPITQNLLDILIKKYSSDTYFSDYVTQVETYLKQNSYV